MTTSSFICGSLFLVANGIALLTMAVNGLVLYSSSVSFLIFLGITGFGCPVLLALAGVCSLIAVSASAYCTRHDTENREKLLKYLLRPAKVGGRGREKAAQKAALEVFYVQSTAWQIAFLTALQQKDAQCFDAFIRTLCASAEDKDSEKFKIIKKLLADCRLEAFLNLLTQEQELLLHKKMLREGAYRQAQKIRFVEKRHGYWGALYAEWENHQKEQRALLS